MPLYLIIFLLINITLNYSTRAATNGGCPETLTSQQLMQLDQKGQFIYDSKVYVLNGSSRQILHNVSLKVTDKEPYQRTSSNGKVECWYQTSRGHIGISQK